MITHKDEYHIKIQILKKYNNIKYLEMLLKCRTKKKKNLDDRINITIDYEYQKCTTKKKKMKKKNLDKINITIIFI